MSEGLQLLRKPFAANHISKLPKPTKAQTEAVRADFKQGHRCIDCGAWHAKGVVHLDYVGHAALTDRLLDADPGWFWEPLAMAETGLPVMDQLGGMWIKLTVCGTTRIGYGHAGDKQGGDAIKEVIGDALRNAAMRFGAALDLWHKGQLHADEDAPKQGPVAISATREAWDRLDPDTQSSMRKIALGVTAAMPDAKKALSIIDDEDLDPDRKVGLWHLLDSATRSGIKKAQAEKEAA